MYIELNGDAWKKFVEFFRKEKGYTDWSDDEIDDTRTDDDIAEFIVWLVEQLERE